VDGETELTKVIVAFRKFCESAKIGVGEGVGITVWVVPFMFKKKQTI